MCDKQAMTQAMAEVAKAELALQFAKDDVERKKAALAIAIKRAESIVKKRHQKP